MASRQEKQRRELKYTDAREWAQKQDAGFESTCFKLPDGVEEFKLKKVGFYKIDVIPYFVGKNNPRADEGFVHTERTFYTHNGLGLQGKSSYCCAGCWPNKKCFICEMLNRNSGTMDKEVVDRIKQKMRQLWNIIDVSSKETREKGIQVWNASYYRGFGELLKNKILAVESYKNFYRPDKGMTLQLSVVETMMGSNKFNQVTNIEMLPRDKPYKEDIIEKATCLDDILIYRSYKEMEKIWAGGEDEDEEEETTTSKSFVVESDDEDDDETPVRKSSKAPAVEDEDEDEEGDEDSDDKEKTSEGFSVGDTVTYEYRGKQHKGDILSINDEKGIAKVDNGKGIQIVDLGDLTLVKDDEEDSDESEEEETPVKKSSKKTAKVVDDFDDEPEEEENEDEDEEDEEEEEPTPKKKGKAAASEDDDWDPPSPKKGKATAKVVDDFDDDSDEPEEEEEPAPKPKRGRK